MASCLEDMDIYPYERIESERRRKRKKTRRLSLGGSLIERLLLAAGSLKVPTFSLSPNWPLYRMTAAVIFQPANLLIWGICLLLSRSYILGEIMPFAFAWIGAWMPEKRYQRLLLALAAITGFTTVCQGFILTANIVACLLLIICLPRLTSERSNNWVMRPLLVGLILLSAKCIVLLGAHPSFYRAMVFTFEALMAAVLTFVFLIANEAVREKKSVQEYSFEEMTAMAILGVGLIIGLMDIGYRGIMLTGILCRAGIMVAALIWGPAGATMVGVLTGAIPAIANTTFPQTLAAYSLTGLFAGLFRSFGRLGVFLGFAAGTMLFTVFSPNSVAAMSTLWETGAAALIFFLLPGWVKASPVVTSLGFIGREREAGEIKEQVSQTAGERLSRLARVFDEMSATFSPDKSATSPAPGLKDIFEDIAGGFCSGCSLYDTCWDREFYRTYRDLFNLLTLVEQKGEARFLDADENLRRRCIRARELVTTANCLVSNYKMNKYWKGMISESNGMLAEQLKGVAEVMRGLSEELKSPAEVDDEARQRLMSGGRQHLLGVKDILPVRVNGQVFLKVTAPACASGDRCYAELADALSSLMGRSYVVAEKSCPRLRRGTCSFTLKPFHSYRVETGVAQAARGAVCGDSFTVATLRGGQELVILSDGMGSGKEAARESRLAVRLLEELLDGGFSRERAIATINSVLLLRSAGERFVTLDMMLVDLDSGEASFIKIGAAPGFIKRGASVNIVTSPGLPVGVMEDVSPREQSVLLQAGDMVVMASDGVLEAGGSHQSTNWVPAFLSVIDEEDPQRLADMVLGKALERTRGQMRDDMTVLCSRIELNYR